MSSDHITLRPLRQEDLPGLRAFVIDNFGRKEPISQFLDTPQEAFTEYYDTIKFSDHTDLPTSMVACLPSGRIVSCFLTTPLDITPASLSQERQIIGKLATGPYGQDLAGYLAVTAFTLENYIHDGSSINKRILKIRFCATADGFEGKQLMQQLARGSLIRAKEIGWDLMTVVCTNPATQYLSKMFNCKEITEIRFDQLVWDGRKPLIGMQGTVLVSQQDLHTFQISDIIGFESIHHTTESDFPPMAKL